jgi:hypothetical protein
MSERPSDTVPLSVPLPLKEIDIRQVNTTSIRSRDGNGYPKLDYPTSFTLYEGRYGIISLLAGMLMGKNLYPLGRRVRIRVGTIYTRLPMSRINTSITI